MRSWSFLIFPDCVDAFNGNFMGSACRSTGAASPGVRMLRTALTSAIAGRDVDPAFVDHEVPVNVCVRRCRQKNVGCCILWSFGGRFLNPCPSQVILTDEPFTVSSAQPGVDAATPVSRQGQVASTQFLADFG